MFSVRVLRLFKRSLAAAILLAGAALTAHAQELLCRATVDRSMISGAEFEHVTEMGRVIEEYMNERRWTEDRYQDNERIDCNLQITLTQVEGLDRFRARLSVGSRRPIYGTGQYTHVFQLIDSDWQFQYAQNQTLLFDLNRFDSFVSVLDFYAYLILGFDYDTFSELGGTPHFERARRIAELAASSGAAGWSAAGTDRSRAALISQILDPRMRPLRQAYYKYHYYGLDHFTIAPDEARNAVLESLQDLQKLFEAVSRQYVLDLFFSTKYQELVAVFLDSNERRSAYGLLLQVDPSHSSTYDRLVQ